MVVNWLFLYCLSLQLILITIFYIFSIFFLFMNQVATFTFYVMLLLPWSIYIRINLAVVTDAVALGGKLGRKWQRLPDPPPHFQAAPPSLTHPVWQGHLWTGRTPGGVTHTAQDEPKQKHQDEPKQKQRLRGPEGKQQWPEVGGGMKWEGRERGEVQEDGKAEEGSALTMVTCTAHTRYPQH